MFMGYPPPCHVNPRMASPALLLAAVFLLFPSCVQYYPVAAVAPTPQAPAYPTQVAELPAAQAAPQEGAPARPPPSANDQLLGPIALYPDPLLSLILPASTVPADISAASAYLVQYGDASRIDSQPWDPSVRALAHYPTIITWMAENIEWTRALGSAFLSSPGDVMDSIQRLRARAMAAGALASTPQQQVVLQDNEIEILPAQPDSIYAPAYDADVVYSEEPYYGYGGPFINFGDALPVGLWLSFGFDWRSHSVWAGGWGAWHGPGGWHHPHFDGDHSPPGTRPWHPPVRGPGSGTPPTNRGWHGDSVPLPHPIFGAPNPPPSHFRQPQAQAGGQPGASASAVPVPRTSAPPMDRPRLQRVADSAPNEPRASEPERRYAPQGGAPRAPGNSQAPATNEAPAPAAHSVPAREAEPAQPRESAPASSHQSSPAASHESAPAPSRGSSPAPAPAAAPASDPRNR
jgi:hypothetical protein